MAAQRKTKDAAFRQRRWWVSLLKWTGVAAVWGIILVGGVMAWYAADLPDVDAAIAATRRPTVTILAADGSTLAARGDLYGAPVKLRELPPALPQAVLATEDRRFYEHFGLDVIGLARAMVANVRAGRIVQGGSTITQQAAKNLFLKPDRTLKRKVQELLLALWLERKFTKDEILTVYLNRVYLGAGTYGVEAASRKYFGRAARDLGVYQSALLAGLLKAPSRYNPIANPKLAAGRTDQVLANMQAAGYVTGEDMAAAKSRKQSAFAARRTQRFGRYFVDWVLEQVSDYVFPGDQDLTVSTTLDPRLQADAEARIGRLLAANGKPLKVSQAALVTLARDGAVRALVGGRDYGQSQFNRATQAKRQPGSAFKPFVYLAALEAGLKPDSRFVDAPLTIDGWSPRNFTRKHLGPITLETALARSVNTVAVRVSEQVGRRKVIEVARRLGLAGPFQPHPSLALGTGEVSLLDLTAAYAPFANGGVGVWAYGIEKITGGGGRLLYQRSGTGPGRVVEAATAKTLSAMLRTTVRSGSGRAAALSVPVAGKTGTSQDNRDAWFIGYAGRLITGVWMGNDNGAPMNNVTGGGLPARLWQAYMARALKAKAGTGAAPPAPKKRPPSPPPPEEPGLFDSLKKLFFGE